jgi:hypothetical protein
MPRRLRRRRSRPPRAGRGQGSSASVPFLSPLVTAAQVEQPGDKLDQEILRKASALARGALAGRAQAAAEVVGNAPPDQCKDSLNNQYTGGMWRYLAIACVASAFPIVSSGCGEADSASSEQSAISASLIRVGDLPAGAEEVASLPPSPCDPLSVFSSEGSEFAKSSMFAVGQTRVQEAAGRFASGSAAARAYDALNAKPRLRCIGNAIALQGDLSVRVHPSHSLDVGGEAEAVLFEVHDLDSGKRSSVEVASVRSKRSVASLIFVGQTQELDTSFVDAVVDAAAGRLAQGRGGKG